MKGVKTIGKSTYRGWIGSKMSKMGGFYPTYIYE